MRFEILTAALLGWAVVHPGVVVAAEAVPPSAPVDGVAAAIGFDVVSRSLLEAYRAAFWPGQPRDAALRALIDERLLATEARRYGLAVPEAGLRELAARHPLPAGFRADEWRAVLTDRVLARQFLTFRFGDFVAVGRDEIAAYVARHPELARLSAEAREAEARARLVPEVRARREADFLDELRARAGVRWLEPPSSRE